MSEPDPLGLDASSDPLGIEQCESEPPPHVDGSSQVEVALAIGRAIDALAELTKLLPLDLEIARQLRSDLFNSWRRASEAAGLCESAPELEVESGH